MDQRQAQLAIQEVLTDAALNSLRNDKARIRIEAEVREVLRQLYESGGHVLDSYAEPIYGLENVSLNVSFSDFKQCQIKIDRLERENALMCCDVLADRLVLELSKTSAQELISRLQQAIDKATKTGGAWFAQDAIVDRKNSTAIFRIKN